MCIANHLRRFPALVMGRYWSCLQRMTEDCTAFGTSTLPDGGLLLTVLGGI